MSSEEVLATDILEHDDARALAVPIVGSRGERQHGHCAGRCPNADRCTAGEQRVVGVQASSAVIF